VIGGLITSTALTLFLLPAVCKLILRRFKVEGDNRSVKQASSSLERKMDLRAAE
jgi:hypothetical protein